MALGTTREPCHRGRYRRVLEPHSHPSTCKRSRSAATLNGLPRHLDVVFQHLRSNSESQRSLREGTGLTINRNIVAVVPDGKTSYLESTRRRTPLPERSCQLSLEIDVPRFVPGGVRVRDVGRCQFLPDAQQVQILFEITSQCV